MLKETSFSASPNLGSACFLPAALAAATAESTAEAFRSAGLFVSAAADSLLSFSASAMKAAGNTATRVIDESAAEGVWPLADLARSWPGLLRTQLRALNGAAQEMCDYHFREAGRLSRAFHDGLESGQGESVRDYWRAKSEALSRLAIEYPAAIRDIKERFGFHFERPGYEFIAETARFFVYRVLPQTQETAVAPCAKPVLLIPPYVLGANILCFLPHEGKSFAHAFADCGIPTYIRVVKDIRTSIDVQRMTPEHDALDTRLFAERLRSFHGQPVTLLGYCQGGFMATVNVLSGALDGLVDKLITCVAPLDGSRSDGLRDYLSTLPPRFRRLEYSMKPLTGGSAVVDADLMSLLYKLKSIGRDNPVSAFYRDLQMFDRLEGSPAGISSTAAAINHWLLYDRCDLPPEIVRLSLQSYSAPVASDGTLPVRLFGRGLNFKRLPAHGVKMLICYGAQDDLVEPAAALAPCDFIPARTVEYPKGHVAMATSLCHPKGEWAFNKKGGPVAFHLEK